tara:strand:- start:266 stop:418 length:153 start_codon:yes stop_codon:yes gene_type:complete
MIHEIDSLAVAIRKVKLLNMDVPESSPKHKIGIRGEKIDHRPGFFSRNEI